MLTEALRCGSVCIDEDLHWIDVPPAQRGQCQSILGVAATGDAILMYENTSDNSRSTFRVCSLISEYELQMFGHFGFEGQRQSTFMPSRKRVNDVRSTNMVHTD